MQSKLISNNYQLMFFYLLNNRRPVVSVADFLHSNDSHTIYASCVHIYCVASTDSAIYLKIYLDRLISKFNRNLKLQDDSWIGPVDQARDIIIIEFPSLNLNWANYFFFPSSSFCTTQIILEAQFYFKHQFILEMIWRRVRGIYYDSLFRLERYRKEI